MPQPVNQWDIELYGCPEQRGYQVDQLSLQRTGRPIEGSTRFRRVQQEGVLVIQVQVPQTPDEYEAFRAFYFNTLNAGEAWFFMPLLVGLETLSLVCHIRDGFSQDRNQTVYDSFLTRFTVEAYRKANIPYIPIEDNVVDATTPDNPDLATLDIIDATDPANPALDTLDVVYGGFQIGLPL